MKKLVVLSVAMILVLAASAATAQLSSSKTPSSGAAIQGTPGPAGAFPSTPDTILSVDISGTNSWDLQADPDNEIVSEVIGVGGILTGIGWDVTITTVGGSWLSEAVIFLDPIQGLTLTIGVGDDAPGSMAYSSGGVVDLTDNGFADVAADGAGNYSMEFFESFDDAPDAIDATFDNGTLDLAIIAGVGVPTLPNVALMILVMGLLAAATWHLRRRQSES